MLGRGTRANNTIMSPRKNMLFFLLFFIFYFWSPIRRLVVLGSISQVRVEGKRERGGKKNSPMRPKPLMATFTLASVVVLTAAACGKNGGSEWGAMSARVHRLSHGCAKVARRLSPNTHIVRGKKKKKKIVKLTGPRLMCELDWITKEQYMNN